MTKSLSTEKWLVLAALLALVAAVFARTFAQFAQGWHEEENMHGVLVAPIVAFLLWMNWARLKATPVRGNVPLGLTVLSLALLVQVGAIWLGFNRSAGYAFVLAVLGLCLYFLGTAMTRELAFPLAFLLFMVPVPGGLLDLASSPLQLISARMAQMLLGLTGVVVRQEGVSLVGQDSAGHEFNLYVAVGCSGLHSLIAMGMLAALLAYFMAVPLPYKWGLFALAVPLALLGNVVRLYLIVLIASKHGQAAGMAFHDGTVGKFIPFLLAFFVLLGVGRVIEWQLARRNAPTATETA